MEIKEMAKLIAENAYGKRVSNENKKTEEKNINNLIMSILIKNKLLEKLNITPNAGFEPKNDEAREAKIKEQVKNLADFGLISEELGKKICQNLGVTLEENESESPESTCFENMDEEFSEFFNKRNSVLDYLKNSGADFSKEELQKIMNMIKSLEEQAKAEYSKELYSNKLKAISPPNSLAGSTSGSPLEAEKALTAKEIAKMSTDEFLKNEKLINKMLAKKLIK